MEVEGGGRAINWPFCVVSGWNHLQPKLAGDTHTLFGHKGDVFLGWVVATIHDGV